MPSGVKDIQLLELKDTISQLNKTISTQNELISSLQKMLEERNAKDSEKDLLIANLQSQLAYLKNKVFGSTSEIRHDQLDGQLNLFGTPVGDEKPAEVIEPEVISVKGYTKERKPKATYDDKYNSVRSICKHFFTDIVGLSIKFFCVSLRHMSIDEPHVISLLLSDPVIAAHWQDYRCIVGTQSGPNPPEDVYAVRIAAKKRSIDPLVQAENGLRRFTAISTDYAARLCTFRADDFDRWVWARFE